MHIFCRIAKTLCFSNRGHGLYLSSPMEIQKFSVSSEFWYCLTCISFTFSSINQLVLYILVYIDAFCLTLNFTQYVNYIFIWLVANWRRWWAICLLATICRNRLKRVSSKVYSVVVRGVSIEKSCVSRHLYWL